MKKASTRSKYDPDYISPPGETLREMLDVLCITQAELAERIGRRRPTVSNLVNGRMAISSHTAIQLERALGVPASFWLNRQRRFDEHIARAAERHKLQEQCAWLRRFPIAQMVRHQWIERKDDRTEQLRALLSFFGVSSQENWEKVYARQLAYYRSSKSVQRSPHALAAWLRRGEVVGRAIDCLPYDRGRFVDTLGTARSLTRKPIKESSVELMRLCSRCGVAVVFVRELPRAPVFGATRWLSTDKAMIQLSLRYKTDDQLWFTFFHESAHILNHSKKGVNIEASAEPQDQEDLEANRFAANLLIPPNEYAKFVRQAEPTGFDRHSIEEFAEQLNISPGIVVGRLQHDKRLGWATRLNRLKAKLELRTG